MIKAENIRFDTTIKGQALRSMDEHFSYASNASRESLLLNLGRAFLVSKKVTENQKHQLILVLNKVGLLLPPIDDQGEIDYALYAITENADLQVQALTTTFKAWNNRGNPKELMTDFHSLFCSAERLGLTLYSEENVNLEEGYKAIIDSRNTAFENRGSTAAGLTNFYNMETNEAIGVLNTTSPLDLIECEAYEEFLEYPFVERVQKSESPIEVFQIMQDLILTGIGCGLEERMINSGIEPLV